MKRGNFIQEEFSRTEMLLGADVMDRLARSRVAVFGVGGVGGYVCEALARSGVGALDLIDRDKVAVSNINRQISPPRPPHNHIRQKESCPHFPAGKNKDKPAPAPVG